MSVKLFSQQKISNTRLKPLNFSIDYLVVGGGGSGSGGTLSANYGSGGAGGVVRQSSLAINLNSTTSFKVTVGAGATTVSGNSPGQTGGSSVFGSVTATGGGGGTTGATGGSNADYSGGVGTGQFPGGGGAGAGGNGSDINGGIGVSSSITGSTIGYGGGGGGSRQGTAGTATNGGGAGSNGTATPGTANRGGGGGGGGTNGQQNGGSGVVILRIPDGYTATFSGGVTSSLSTAVAGFKIYTVTATSTTNETVTFS